MDPLQHDPSTETPSVWLIHGAVAGRVRYKVAGLYAAPSVKRLLEVELAAYAPIQRVSASTRTGTVLVTFDAGCDVEEISALLMAVLELGPARAANATRASGRGVHPAPRLVARLKQIVREARAEALRAWHAMETPAVLKRVETDRARGLARTEARDRLRRYGPNVVPVPPGRSPLGILVSQLDSLPVAMLLASGALSLATGGVVDAGAIGLVIVINALIGYATESRTERTIRDLGGAPQRDVQVLRDGKLRTLPARDVVYGDLIALDGGVRVAADARLIEVQDLSVDESSLTGESQPVFKSVAPLDGPDVPLADRASMVYMGTQVVGGRGLAVAVATGRQTEIGRIQYLIGEAEAPATPLEQRLRDLGNKVVAVATLACAGTFVVGLARGYGFLPMLRNAISLAVAAIPEGLPTIAVTTLALGVARMRLHGVLIRRLGAVEALGQVQMICLDKTGTVTENRMAVSALHVAGQDLDQHARERGPREAVIRLAQAVVLCNDAEIVMRHGEQRLRGSPTEAALVEFTQSLGIDVHALRAQLPRVTVRHRAESRPYMTTVHEGDDARRVAFTKGNPTDVLALARHFVDGGGIVQPLTAARRAEIIGANVRLADRALRVLGVAYRPLDGDDDAESDLVWLGLVGLADPLRAGAREAVGRLRDAGIEAVMITGDQSATARAILGALHLDGEVAEATDLDNGHRIDPARVRAYARVNPSDKLRIVRALQASGKVVAMTGDGINDGPALKAADVGIAMGRGGTDVARTVADVVLEHDDLQTLLAAIGQGRSLHDNIRKAVEFLLATNLSEILITFATIAAGFGEALTPMQLLWINLVTDIFPGLALAMDQPEPDVLARAPRNPRDPLFATADLRRIAVDGTIMAGSGLAAYAYGRLRGRDAGGLAFNALVGAQLLHAFSCRAPASGAFRDPRPGNPFLRMAVGGSLALQLTARLIPGLNRVLGMGALTPLDLAVVAGAAVLPFGVREGWKGLRRSGAPTEQRARQRWHEALGSVHRKTFEKEHR